MSLSRTGVIEFELDDGSSVWINPRQVVAVKKNESVGDGNYTDIIFGDGRKFTVANQVQDVVNRIDIWLT